MIEKGLTVGGKSLKEHLEATNHAGALKFVRSLIRKKPWRISGQDILGVHGLILRGVDDENAGRFRNVPVRISGSAVVMPNPRKVPELMEDFLAWLGEKHDLHPVALAGEAHYRLVSIHPFTDGNGRTARLLMNLLLMQQGYPPPSFACATGWPILARWKRRNWAGQDWLMTGLSPVQQNDPWIYI